jgi:hypothetical protein
MCTRHLRATQDRVFYSCACCTNMPEQCSKQWCSNARQPEHQIQNQPGRSITSRCMSCKRICRYTARYEEGLATYRSSAGHAMAGAVSGVKTARACANNQHHNNAASMCLFTVCVGTLALHDHIKTSLTPPPSCGNDAANQWGLVNW